MTKSGLASIRSAIRLRTSVRSSFRRPLPKPGRATAIRHDAKVRNADAEHRSLVVDQSTQVVNEHRVHRDLVDGAARPRATCRMADWSGSGLPTVRGS